MIESGRMRWAGHIARMGTKRNVCGILVGKPEGKTPLERPRHRWWTTLKWILDRQDEVVWNGSTWLRIGTNGVLLRMQ
jgi:hypothetical protein